MKLKRLIEQVEQYRDTAARTRSKVYDGSSFQYWNGCTVAADFFLRLLKVERDDNAG